MSPEVCLWIILKKNKNVERETDAKVLQSVKFLANIFFTFLPIRGAAKVAKKLLGVKHLWIEPVEK